MRSEGERADQARVKDEATGGRARTGRAPAAPPAGRRPREIGGPKGPEPTRYGDWERGGRCIDF